MNIQEFADALASKDLNRYKVWFAEDMRLYTPIHEEPSTGKQSACLILLVVFSCFDNFHYLDVLTKQQTNALIFSAEVNGISLEGVDYLRTDDRGLVTEFYVMMRPLKAITELSDVIGIKMQQQNNNA
ncbi:MAG: hypothetical protein M3R36_16215 [Bacteroidota bacterium]|nr:hypothetical protein [Bacteroidota bacterium]